MFTDEYSLLFIIEFVGNFVVLKRIYPHLEPISGICTFRLECGQALFRGFFIVDGSSSAPARAGGGNPSLPNGALPHKLAELGVMYETYHKRVNLVLPIPRKHENALHLCAARLGASHCQSDGAPQPI